jgi:hypothetical protein
VFKIKQLTINLGQVPFILESKASAFGTHTTVPFILDSAAYAQGLIKTPKAKALDSKKTPKAKALDSKKTSKAKALDSNAWLCHP